MTPERKRPPAYLGWITALLALYLLLAAAGLLPIDPADVHVPYWMLGLIGFALLIAACMVLFGHHSRLNDGLAAVFCAAIALAGAWIAIRGPADGFSGGLPFLPREWNVKLGRAMFGAGAAVSVSIGVYALRRALRRNHRSR